MIPRGIQAWSKNKKVERTAPGSKNHYKVTYWDGQEKWTDQYPGAGKPGKREQKLENKKQGRPSVQDAKGTLAAAVKKYVSGGEKGILENAVDNVIVHLGREMAKETIRKYLKENKTDEDGKVKEAQGVIRDRMTDKLRGKKVMNGRIDKIASRVAGSTYPTMQQVEHAELYQLVHWNRYLPSPGEWAIGGRNRAEFERALNHEAPIITRIVERIKELGGITPSVSKAVGWDRYR